MGVVRYSATYTSDERNRGFGRLNTVFYYLGDAVTEEQAVTIARNIGGLINGKLTSVSKLIFSDSKEGAPEGMPGELVKLLFKNDQGQIEQISWVYGDPSKTDDDIKSVFHDSVPAFQNRYGGDLGECIKLTRTPLGP